MNALILGSGGREHALYWAVKKSSLCRHLWVAPGNGGIEDNHRVNLDPENADEVLSFCEKNGVDFVIIGPEAPLAAGVGDVLRNAGILTFGCSKAAAKLETSKSFAKEVMERAGVKTAHWQKFDDLSSAKAYVANQSFPLVVKADGLAAGKGVVICETLQDAENALDDMLVKKVFGETSVVIEAFLTGVEASFFALCHGKEAVAFGSAQDHKAVGEGNTGPNTGGMGALTPAPALPPEKFNKTLETVVNPVLKAMDEMGCPFQGVLFVGLMIGEEGTNVLEFNVRFGDPECQALMMLSEKNDMLAILHAVAKGNLQNIQPQFSDGVAMTVVMASKGYPGSYEKGSIVQGLDNLKDVTVFHAGTQKNDKGEIVATGGRVLNVTTRGQDVTDARQKIYDAIDDINWPQGFYRRDIGV